MIGNETRLQLEKITDEGLFERLADAVLREEDHQCRQLSHLGVNAEGKTIKGPLDGLVYVMDECGKRHMLAVHHTTCRAAGLRTKWLNETDGDVTKTLREFREARKGNPDLRGTLILTTNRDPAPELIHEVEFASQKEGMEAIIYPASALSHFLDIDPKGQWIRRQFLGMEPSHLSEELLKELSKRSIALASVINDPKMWVDRQFDIELGTFDGQMQFVVGESGVGKSVACLKYLQNHVQNGGIGLNVTAEVLNDSLNLEDAIERTLKKLQPSLIDGVGREALSLTSNAAPLVIVVEDISRSTQPAKLLETLVSWIDRQRGTGSASWRLLCPAWPSIMEQIGQEASKIAAKCIWTLGTFTPSEATQAVRTHSKESFSLLQAQEISLALGCDPLLIALHGSADTEPNPRTVISEYVERELVNLSSTVSKYTVGEFRGTLRCLSLEMLERKQLSPKFSEVLQWARDHDTKEMLRELLKSSELVRIDGPVDDELVAFRHDRVRDRVLADAVSDALSRRKLSKSVMSDPFFAEVLGIAIFDISTTALTFDEITVSNPLALFCALKHCSKALGREPERTLIERAQAWVCGGTWKEPSNAALRDAILSALSACDGPHVVELSKTMGYFDHWSLRARFRNGDVSAGLTLCAMVEPGVGWVGHVEVIDHAMETWGDSLIQDLDRVLRQTNLSTTARAGALRLGGFMRSPKLENAILESWASHSARVDMLSDYFWACSQCCGDEPPLALAPMFDAWEALSDEDEDGIGSRRVNFGADTIRWAFRDRVPIRAIAYFLERAKDELEWPITVMLNGIDHPDALEFVVRKIAEVDERSGGSIGFFPFAHSAIDEWRERKQRGMRAMSHESRNRLFAFWSNDQVGMHIRKRALQFWSESIDKTDITVLQTIDLDSNIGDIALMQRLRRGDSLAIPNLVKKLETDESGYWWQAGRYVWTNDLTDCLDRTLARRAEDLGQDGHESLKRLDSILSEVLVELPARTAERLIGKHWTGLCRSGLYIKSALYVATTDMTAKAHNAIREWDAPTSPLEHIGKLYGIRIVGRRGVTRIEQLDVLLPYLCDVSDQDIGLLWRECNRNGWFEWRRRNLDSRVSSLGIRFVDDDAAIDKLDRLLATTGPMLGMDQWANELLDIGLSISKMMDVLRRWLAGRKEKRSLLIAATLVTQFGTREHLAVLSEHGLANSEIGQEIIRNASFALRLRSMN